MNEAELVVFVRSCAFCGQGVDPSAPTSLNLMTRTPAGRVGSFQAHASCFADALHPNSRRGVEDASRLDDDGMHGNG